jgi:hypothetical protein
LKCFEQNEKGNTGKQYRPQHKKKQNKVLTKKTNDNNNFSKVFVFFAHPLCLLSCFINSANFASKTKELGRF